MKRAFIILWLLSFFKLGVCQDYESIVDTNKMWVVFQQSASDPPGGYGQSYAYKISDSILLGSNYWYKVWEANDSNYNNWSSHGYIREENNIVLYKNPDITGIDTILYNFNLNINDTILIDECALIIYDMDTSLFAEKERITQYIDDNNWRVIKHIEGIGSTNGLLDPYFYCFTGVIRTLQCVYENGELIYQNPAFNNCYIYNPYTCLAKFSYLIDSLIVSFTNLSDGMYSESTWDFGDGQYSNEENPVHTYMDTGIYTVNLTIYDSFGGCTANYLLNIPITGTNVVDINQEDTKETIKLYPNPSSNQINIEVNNLGNNYKIVLYNILGKEIINQYLIRKNTKIQLSNINNGIYLYIITKQNKIVMQGKIIINP